MLLPYLVALMSRFTARSAEQNQGCFEEFRTDSPIYGGFLCWFPNYVLTYFLFFWIPNHQMVVSNLWFLVHLTWDDDPIHIGQPWSWNRCLSPFFEVVISLKWVGYELLLYIFLGFLGFEHVRIRHVRNQDMSGSETWLEGRHNDVKTTTDG